MRHSEGLMPMRTAQYPLALKISQVNLPLKEGLQQKKEASVRYPSHFTKQHHSLLKLIQNLRLAKLTPNSLESSLADTYPLNPPPH